MIRFLTAVLMLASLTVRADTQVPHTFEDGEVISATEFNQNFDTLESAIDDIPAGATGAQGPQGEQGPAGADPFAGLNCDVGDQLRMGSGGWECGAEPITASLIHNSWEYSLIDLLGGGEPITSMFESLNNVDTATACEYMDCFIRVIGVADHSSCVTQVTGGAVSGNALVNISTSPIDIAIGDINTWNPLQAVYINISCTP